MVLYENTIRNFADSVFHGRLTGFLADEYESALGKQPDPLLKAQWKYMMRLIYEYTVTGGIIGGVDPSCGIRIDLCLSSLQTSTMILLASGKDGKENVAVMEMLPWESVRLSGEEDMVIYSDDTGEHEVIHPSYQIIEYTKYISKGRFDEDITFRPFVYLHECEQLRETDIENNYKPEIIRLAPIVYAGDEEEFISYTNDALTGKDGSKVLRHLHQLEEMPIRDNTGGLFDDQKYIYALTRRYLATSRPAWFLIKNPPGSGASRLIKDIEKMAVSLPGKLTVIEKDREPAPGDFTKDGVTLWFYGEYEDKGSLEAVRQKGKNERVPVHDFTLHVPSAKYEAGSGLGLLASILGLSKNHRTDWDPDLYRISVAENDTQKSADPGVATVTIDGRFTYDPEADRIIAGQEDRRKLYQKLSAGKHGVILHVKDHDLKEYLKRKVEEARAKIGWIKEYAKSFTASELPEEKKGELPDTDAAKKYYASRLEKSMGAEAWEKMAEMSRKWIISGVVAYSEMKDYDQLLDFSGVCIQICKAAESELAVRLFSGFRDWLMAKYGSRAAEKAPYEMLEGKKNGTKFVEPERISLGQYEHIIGLDHKGRVIDDYAWREFSSYAKETLLNSGLDPAKTLSEHLTYIDKIRLEYRNQAAHTESIDVTKAKSCIDYVVGSLHRLGVMLDDYKF